MKFGSIYVKALFIIVCIISLFLGIIYSLFYYYSKELPPLPELEQFDMKIGTKVYDKDEKLLYTFATQNREMVSLNDIAPHLKNAFLSIEDYKFYQHSGIYLKGIARAFLVNFLHAKITQGASTISQQLARDMFLHYERTISRKIKEALLTIKIEKNFSKDQILEMYLNSIYLGDGNYGVESISQKYFGKSASQVSLSESALIAGLPRAPNYYNPYKNYKAALGRRNVVLTRMRNLQYITQDEYEQALSDSIRLIRKGEKHGPADYFLEYVRSYIEKKYGASILYTGGLKVYTTVDYGLTAFADSVLNAHLTVLEQKNRYKVKYKDIPADAVDIDTKYVQGGIFAIEPSTGYVRVMIGGRNFTHSKFNRVLQAKRQPGSAFKPIVYTCALDNGYTTATMINDIPIVVTQKGEVYWQPKNYTGKFSGLIRLRRALQHSVNIAAIKLMYELSPQKVIKYAKRIGINAELYPYLSLAIGSFEVQPYDLITAYCVFPNMGEKVEPIFITKIEDIDGKILESYQPRKVRVISPQVAYLMVSVMQSVTSEKGGTGYGIRWRGFKLPAGGKTGTTDNFRDAWFIGYTTNMVLGIWVGFDDNHSLGNKQSGAAVALPPWPYIMNYFVNNEKAIKNTFGNQIIDESAYEFQIPDGIVTVTIDDSTGLLPTPFSSKLYDEVFIEGTEPTLLSDSLGYNFGPCGKSDYGLDTLYIPLEEYKYNFAKPF
ncbi:MAG: penicillin-binding protein 1A [Candidatus Cloacimonadota bacterium]|nr:MAG: penicillin-binding protein 1A [Candidatus Cloacimonadota bacterium]